MQEIICILDGSGSMELVAKEACSGFNEFLKGQKEIGEANLTIAWFNNEYHVDYEGKLNSAPDIRKWRSSGMTGLYDAIGKTFAHVKNRFTKEKPEKVILVIQTDGLENCSKEYSMMAVKRLIEEHESKYGWTVIFLGAGLDAIKQASYIGVQPRNSYAYEAQETRKAFSGACGQSVTSARTEN